MRSTYRSVLVFVLLLLVVIISGPAVFAAFLGNLGVVALTPVLIERMAGVADSSGLQTRANSAAQFLGLAASMQPDRGNLYPFLAMANLESDDLTNAAQAFSTAQRMGSLGIRLRTEDYRYHILSAKILEQAGQFEESITEYRLGLSAGAGRLFPAYYRAYYSTLAEAYAEGAIPAPNAVQADYFAGRWFWMAANYVKAAALFEELLGDTASEGNPNLLFHYQLARAHTYLGEFAEQQGQPMVGATHYETAIAIDPDFAPAWLRLAGLDSTLHSTATCLARQRLVDLQPDVIVQKPRPSGCILEGYTIDQETLEAGPWVEMILFWRGVGTMHSVPPSWQQIAEDRWVQAGVFLNLAPNAGFEWSSPSEVQRFGYSNEVYGEPIPPHQIVVRNRNGSMTHAVGLLHHGVKHSSGLISYPMAVESHAIYLVTAWSYSDEGFGGLGIHWVGRALNFTPCNSKTGEWFPCIGLQQPPAGATEAQIWIIQYQTPYDVYFDDVLFVQLPTN